MIEVIDRKLYTFLLTMLPTTGGTLPLRGHSISNCPVLLILLPSVASDFFLAHDVY